MAKAVTLKNSNSEEVYPVTDVSLVNGQMITAQISDSAISTAKIADGAVTPGKLSFGKYSTTKQQIGTWIDNRPVYRVVLTGTTASANNEYTTSLGLNIDILLNVHGGLKATNGFIEPVQRIVPDNNMTTYSIGVGDFQPVTGGYMWLFQHTSNLYWGVPYYLIIEYVEPAS